jgi:hypothetical protein
VNAERLHAIAIAMREELRATEQVATLSELVSSLNNAVSDPGQPNHQVQVASHRATLVAALTAAASNRFPAVWRQNLDALGATDMLGVRLLDRIEEVFARNEITLAAAAQSLAEILEELQKFDTMLDQLLAGLGYFDIGSEELQPGEFEVGFLIPRGLVHNELAGLGNELVELKKALRPILELATGTVPDLKVRTISSSDFQVFIEAIPNVAAILSQVVDALFASYQKIIFMRENIQAMRDKGLPEENAAGVLEYATGIMDVDIEALSGQLIEAYGANLLQDGRENEVKLSVQHSLEWMAGRIDQGVVISIASYAKPEADEADEDAELPEGVTEETERVREAVEERQPRMLAMDMVGEPILGELGKPDESDGHRQPGEG